MPTPRKKTKPKVLTDRETVTYLKLEGRSEIHPGTELSIEGIPGRSKFVRYTKTTSDKEWLDVITSRGFSRTVSPDRIKTIHRKPKKAS